MTPRYPDVVVQLTGEDGNAFAILGRCQRAAKQAKLDPNLIAQFREDATHGDYSHLLATCQAWFTVQ
ncbi:MAG: hypothetical protein EBS53_00700 [Bacteroidetes bacterium]|nr:hypothetical protein [Bacteroidota bacterium]